MSGNDEDQNVIKWEIPKLPLANKMARLVLKGSRQQTFEDACNNLQQIEHNWKIGKQGNEKQPFKNKNYTIKELTKNQDDKNYLMFLENWL